MERKWFYGSKARSNRKRFPLLRTKKETGLSLGCTNKLCSTTNVNRLFMDLKLLLTSKHNVIFKCIARCISRVLIKWRKMKVLIIIMVACKENN